MGSLAANVNPIVLKSDYTILIVKCGDCIDVAVVGTSNIKHKRGKHVDNLYSNFNDTNVTSNLGTNKQMIGYFMTHKNTVDAFIESLDYVHDPLKALLIIKDYEDCLSTNRYYDDIHAAIFKMINRICATRNDEEEI